MRILQLIDSLDAGGAERMAVNYANGLADRIDFSALVSTRREGVLKDLLYSNVNYLFLARKRTVDLIAIWKFRQFVKYNQIEYIHAHGTSIFSAMLLKFVRPKVKIIWHDHYGNSEFLSERPLRLIKIMSYFMDGVISVNESLEKWAKLNLKTKYVYYLPNFSTLQQNEKLITAINGTAGNRIVCLANLREQKNHILLLSVANKLRQSHPKWTFHLIGKDFNDLYSQKLMNRITELNLNNHVFLYGSCTDTTMILKKMDIGILTSSSEGLPLALIEYGINKLPCVVTEVGEIPKIINNGINGFSVKSGDSLQFTNQLKILINSSSLRSILGLNLENTINENFSENSILNDYIHWIKLRV